MTSDRFRQLEDLYHGALELSSDRRATFLTANCGDDESLRREVEALIDQQDGSLFTAGIAALLPRDTPPRGGLEGCSIGGYLLGPLIGSGSMGDVYGARDAKLGRDVAVKILPASLGHHPDRLARFEREARALAAINHPHIAAIHGTIDGEAGMGLVLELVDGITLAERLGANRHTGADRGGLPMNEAADGSGSEQRLTTTNEKQIPNAVSPDGRLLAYVAYGPDGSSDIWLRPLAADAEPRLLVGTPAAEGGARFSPDGRWIVYQSRTAGSAEIYLTSVTDPSRRFPVSNGEGWSPLWSPDGREVCFRSRRPTSGDGHMLAVPVDMTGPEPVFGEPRVLFPTPYQGEGDVGPDGRFLLLHRTRQASPARFIPVVIDWFAELEARVPAR